jgi:hypothetical protein
VKRLAPLLFIVALLGGLYVYIYGFPGQGTDKVNPDKVTGPLGDTITALPDQPWFPTALVAGGIAAIGLFITRRMESSAKYVICIVIGIVVALFMFR